MIKIAVDRYLALGESIPGSRDKIVAQAFAREWVKTAAERNTESAMIIPGNSIRLRNTTHGTIQTDS